MIKRILHGDLVGITVSKLITTFGSELVVVFIPLLLLNTGLKLWQVCLFYVGYAISKLIVNYPSALIINRYGARLGLICGTAATALFMLLLTFYVAWQIGGLLIAMAIMLALQNSFTWNSQHLFISRAMNMERKSRDLATIESLIRIVAVFTPLAGGFIALFFGQVWLTAIATAIVFTSIIPIWRIDQQAGGHATHNQLKYSIKAAPLRDVVANFGFNAHGLVGMMVWPIYLAVFVPDFRTIGIVTTIAALIAIVVLQIAGRRADKGKTYRVLVEGTTASSFVHIIRIIASSNPITITVVSTLYDIVLGYQQNAWASLYYSHTREKGINYIMSMEIAGDMAYVVMWGVLGLVAFTTGDTSFFTVAFGSAAVLAWLCLFMSRERRPIGSGQAAIS